MSLALSDHSESQDCQSSQERTGHHHHHHQQQQQQQSTATNCNSNQTRVNSAHVGYYDAEQCRAYIANQIKVSKIDRFVSQVSKALEVEASMQSRLSNILNMFLLHSTKVVHEFTFKCKKGVQRHRLDRILNQQRKPSKSSSKTDARLSSGSRQCPMISNDLLYGPGVQLVHTLLSQSSAHQSQLHNASKYIKRRKLPVDNDSQLVNNPVDQSNVKLERGCLSEEVYLMSELFEPADFVRELDNLIRNNLHKSKVITSQLGIVGQLFEKLATEHRDKVDIVYAAEEERQAATVIRRSAYNLSMAAIKATSTPVHVNSNANEIS